MSTTLDWGLFGSLLLLLTAGIVALVMASDHSTATRDRTLRHREAADEQRTRRAVAPYLPALPNATHYTGPHYQYQITGAAVPAMQIAPPVLDVPALPGVTTLGQVLAGGWRPSQTEILLALGPGGTRYTAGVGDDLCHIVLCGATGTGKTNTLRLLLVQLLAAGCEVYLCNPKFTIRHWRTGEDWGALAAATMPGHAISDVKAICALLRWARHEELPRRQARFIRGEAPGPSLFLVIDEWPQIASSDPGIADVLGDLVRLGREYLIQLLAVSQDVLTDTMGGTSGDRAQFQTRYYGGGDATSKRVLMTPQPRGGLPEPPGRGLVYLWATPTGRQPELVRVPLVDNGDIERLLGGVSGGASRPSAPLPGRFRVIPADERPEAPPEAAQPTDPEAARRRETVRRLVKQGVPSSEIIRQEWGATGGRSFQTAAQELTAILQELVN